MAQAKAMVLCHEMLPDAKIGPAPNISLIYPQTCDPRDVCAAQNANALRNWLYLDAYVYGEYNHIVWSWLKDQNAEP
ncbi:family 1 glycosylhydrolase, partial [Desulfovibrio desulfuricans]|nr:family 1 glycosylhydrolase [Desulfovibrio desulfuricans]